MTYFTAYKPPVEVIPEVCWTDWVAVGLSVLLAVLVVVAIRIKLTK